MVSIQAVQVLAALGQFSLIFCSLYLEKCGATLFDVLFYLLDHLSSIFDRPHYLNPRDLFLLRITFFAWVIQKDLPRLRAECKVVLAICSV